ncbi:PaaI family thioesterase [Thioclava sp. FR2]|uniref:PaaI family thioesterase n=1 Tax=Thioclava sp. FR2 TaxID=3445780 RepID=UPI003EBD901D
MTTIRAELGQVLDGVAEIHLPNWDGIRQQVGFIHGGVVGMIADSAAGYAALTKAPEGAEVLTIEYKINMLAPATGDKLIARGSVIRAGRTIIVTKSEVFAVTNGAEKLCAQMQQTIMVTNG